jgi:hypothetical protein
MKDIIRFKKFSEFDFRCGEVKEIKKKDILVDINAENLINCNKENLKFNIGDKVIVLLKDSGEGKILAASDDEKVVLLTVDRDIKVGSKIS